MTSFFVPGVPAPQGSKRIVPTAGGPRLISVNDARLKEWRRAVTLLAPRMEWDKKQPLHVLITFVMPATLKERTGWCAVRPDIDKLCRAVLDGLTDAGTFTDDSQVAALTASKTRGIHSGAHITVEALR